MMIIIRSCKIYYTYERDIMLLWDKKLRWPRSMCRSKAVIGNAHMTRSLRLVALESKAGRHVYNGESMHLSVLLRSKIWCSLRIPVAPSLMAPLPLKVDAVSLCWTSLRDSRENVTEKGERAAEGGATRGSLLATGWPHLFTIEASGSPIFVGIWTHRLTFAHVTMRLYLSHSSKADKTNCYKSFDILLSL